MKEAILHLVRFFDREEYADQFMRGRLHLNRLGYYKHLETSRDGRGDYAEAPAAWLQKDNTFIEVPKLPELNIGPKNLAGPVRFSIKHLDNLHILCMTAVHTGEFDLNCENGTILGETNKLTKQLEIDSQCFNMGSFAVMTPRPADFVLRVRTEIEAHGYSCESDLVKYFDPTTFHGHFTPLSSLPFWKRNNFSFQNEYRFCVDTHTNGDNALFIEIGDISDIAEKMPTKAVKTAYQLRVLYYPETKRI